METAPPKGYVLSDVVKEIQVDASAEANEFTIELKTEKYPNTPILGKVAIQKYYSDVDTGLLEPEANTMFQVYLKNKGIKEGPRDDYQYEISDYRRWKDRSYG